MHNFYVIAVPIGNYDDISLRAVKILKQIDFVVCESEREYKKLFGMLGIKEKKFIICSEQNEKEAPEFVMPLLKKGEKGALITDCGTPVFEDPGSSLVNQIRDSGYKVTALPGPNAIINAVSLSPYHLRSFYYAGLLARDSGRRKEELKELLKRKESVFIIEAPFRLKQFLASLKELNIKRDICLFYNMTLDDETIIWGNINKIIENINKLNIKKGEFIILIK